MHLANREDVVTSERVEFMKKLLILAYVITVLLLSGMVKGAQNGHALVESARINPSGIISLDGVLPTPCHKNPRLVVEGINEAKNTLVLGVQTQLKDQICSDVILNKPFKLAFDLKRIPLVVGETYSIIFDNFAGEKNSLQYKAISSDYDFKAMNVDENAFKGFIVNYTSQDVGSGVGFAIQKGNDIIPVVTTDMTAEMEKFKGGEVIMTGYVLSTATMLNNNIENELAPGSQNNQVIVPISVSQ